MLQGEDKKKKIRRDKEREKARDKEGEREREGLLRSGPAGRERLIFELWCVRDMISVCILYNMYREGSVKSAQEWENCTLVGLKMSVVMIIVLAGSRSTITEITEYTYFFVYYDSFHLEPHGSEILIFCDFSSKS